MSTDNVARAENWTDTRVSDLKKMWLEGRSASQIARQLGGVSRNAVIGKVHRMGLGGRDRPTAPRAVGRTNPRRIGAVQSSSMMRRSPVRVRAAPYARLLNPDLKATATILTLEHADCRWPMGDPQEADFGYCGRSRGRHVSYCDHHAGEAMHGRASRRPVESPIRTPDPFAAS
jgi:GcrA cell cycle regulator